MIDTMTVLAYLLTHDPGHSSHLKLQAMFPASCTQQVESPSLRWGNVPPEAESLALIIKDAAKPRYYWVVYNLPVELAALPYGANLQINPYDIGVNSWGSHSYHTVCFNGQPQPVTIELFALKKRFSAHYPMTGEKLEQEIQANALSSAMVIKNV